MENSIIDVEQDYLPTIVNSIRLDTEETPHVGDVVLDITTEMKKVKLKVPEWQSNTSYEKGQLIIYNNELYVVSEDFTSLDAFDKYKFETVATETIVGQYTQGIFYKKGQLLLYNEKLYIVVQDFTSTNFTYDLENNLRRVNLGEGAGSGGSIQLPDVNVITELDYESQEDGLKTRIESYNLESEQKSSIIKDLPEASENSYGIISPNNFQSFKKAGDTISEKGKFLVPATLTNDGYITQSDFKQFYYSNITPMIQFSSSIASTTITNTFKTYDTERNINEFNSLMTKYGISREENKTNLRLRIEMNLFHTSSDLQSLGDTTIQLFMFFVSGTSTPSETSSDLVYHSIVKVDSGTYNLKYLNFPSGIVDLPVSTNSITGTSIQNKKIWLGYKLSDGTSYPCVITGTASLIVVGK